MKELLKMEVKRVRESRTFRIALIIGILITVSQYIMYVLPCVQYLDKYKENPFGSLCPHTWYEKWIGGETISSQAYLFFMLLPVLAVLPHGTSLASDHISGYIYHVFSREKKEKYYLAKYIVTFVSGGVAVIIPLLVNLFLSICTLPSILPDKSTGTSMIAGDMMWVDFYYLHPNLYIIAYLGLIFVFSGLIATLALTIGLYEQNVFLISIVPFVCYLFLYALCYTLDCVELAPFAYLSPAQRVEHVSFIMVLLEMFILWAVPGGVYLYKMKQDETIG